MSENRRRAREKRRREQQRREVERGLLDLRSKHDTTREEAVMALGQAGDVRAIPALIRALEDPSVSVCCRAAEALSQIGTPRVLVPLCRAIADREPEVSAAAANALCALVPHRDPAIRQEREGLLAGLGTDA